MPSEEVKKLEKWIFKENKSITRAFLLRNTSLTSREADELLTTFFNDNKDEDLSASYVVFGRAKRRAFKKKSQGSNDQAEIPVEDINDKIVLKSVICPAEKLESTKSTFIEVQNTYIYSLQKGELDNLRRPLNTNFAGKSIKNYNNIEKRLNIICDDVIEDLKEITERRKAFDMSTIDLPELTAKVKRGPKVFIKKIVVKNDQHSLKDAFAMASSSKGTIIEEEQEVVLKRPDPAEIPLVNNDIKPKPKIEKPKTAPKSKPLPKDNKKDKKNPFIIKEEDNNGNIDEDIVVEEENMEVEEDKISNLKSEDSNEGKVKTRGPKKRTIYDDKQDDLFSAEGEEREAEFTEEENPPEVKKRRVDNSSNKRRVVVSDDEDDEEPAPSENINIKPKRFVKQEYYEEEIDDEGYTVSKLKTRMVEEELPEVTIKAPSKSSSQHSSQPKAPLKPKKAPVGQPKISSFFTKQ